MTKDKRDDAAGAAGSVTVERAVLHRMLEAAVRLVPASDVAGARRAMDLLALGDASDGRFITMISAARAAALRAERA